MNILGNSFSWGLGGYENGQFGHKGSNWKTENAWDLNTQSDTDVYSITDGTVTKIKTLKTGDSHLFGTSIEILGRGEYPTIFYCNLSSVNTNSGVLNGFNVLQVLDDNDPASINVSTNYYMFGNTTMNLYADEVQSTLLEIKDSLCIISKSVE